MERALVASFYKFAKRNRLFGGIVDVVYQLSPFVFSFIYASGGVYLLLYGRENLLRYICVPAAALAASSGLRKLIKRERPYIGLGIPSRKKKKGSYSCPSNHASSAGVIALSMLLISPWLGACACLIAICTGLSRIFTAVHYPSDVLAGFALAGALFFAGGVIPWPAFGI